MLKRLAPALVLVAGLVMLVLPADAHRATDAVAINGFSYMPATITVQQGHTVTWTNNNSSTPHTSTASVRKFWDSGDIGVSGGIFAVTLTDAGTYPYYCTIHGAITMSGVVKVPLIATGTSAAGWTLQWSSRTTAPTNRSFDVQIQRPGSSTWQAFKTATTTRKTFFNPAKTGKYAFRVETNVVPGTGHSKWSPVLTLSIS